MEKARIVINKICVSNNLFYFSDLLLYESKIVDVLICNI